MSVAPTSHHWSPSTFLRAWEDGLFAHRVELVDGEVWPVVIGSWHGDTVVRVVRSLPGSGVCVSSATLPTGDSLPDPDCWVRRADAEPVRTLGARVQAWDPADVLLVVEVSDETMLADLEIRARLYGRAGYPVYWVVTPDAMYEHTEPASCGYRTRTEHRPGQRIPVGYAGASLSVAELLGHGQPLS